MTVEVLLLNDVPSLGQAGETVRVASGYARNYLLPKGIAGPVTEATKRRLEKLRKEREELARIQLQEAKAKAAQLKDVSATIRAKTIDGTKLYGSVQVADIVNALEAQGLAIDRSQIVLDEPIHEVGQFDVPVKLHPQVELTLKVWVVEA